MTIVEKGGIARGDVKQMWRVVTLAAYGCDIATIVCERGDGAARAAAGDFVIATVGTAVGSW